jgi:hypothetical protein
LFNIYWFLMMVLVWFLKCVVLPTLPPYRSDTSISFLLGSSDSDISHSTGVGKESKEGETSLGGLGGK